MEVKLVSKDSQLAKLCAESVAEALPDQSCSFSTVLPDDLGASADFYIWDFEPHWSLPDKMQLNYSNLLVLAHRRQRSEIRNVLGFEPHTVLKPVNRIALTALVSLAVSNTDACALRDDRDQMFQRLIEANVKLQEYDHERTNFLTRVVHDFRAPLTALNGYCGLLLSDRLGTLNDDQQEVIRRMHYSVMRLSRMASGMLQLTLDREIKRGPELQRGNLQITLNQALQEIGYLAKDKNVVIRCELEPCGDWLYFDPAQLDNVIINILDNACKFVPRNGSIEIRGYPFFWERRGEITSITSVPRERRVCDRTAPNSYRVDIRDSGLGIAPDRLERIFEEYTSYPAGADRSGSGLGLAICKRIIDQHRGRVWAENTEQGPMFSFVLPMNRFGAAQVA